MYAQISLATHRTLEILSGWFRKAHALKGQHPELSKEFCFIQHMYKLTDNLKSFRQYSE